MIKQIDSQKFYAELDHFDNFEDFSNPSNYSSVPDDWNVVICDIQGSTNAIAEGRYKEVNMMGASCITAVLNKIKQLDDGRSKGFDIPYVFGGDGTTILVPDQILEDVKSVLLDTKALSKQRFNLEMRIGIVPLSVLREKGLDVLVAKFRLGPRNYLAMFSGGGVDEADRLIKDDQEGQNFRCEIEGARDLPQLEGLSCRWSPIQSQRGNMVSLLISVAEKEQNKRSQAFREIMAQISKALGTNLEAVSPAGQGNLGFKWPPRFWNTEFKTHAGDSLRSKIRCLAIILGQSAIQWILHKTGGKAGAYDAPRYLDEMIRHTDYRRFDDILRLVLDCSESQITDLRTRLEDMSDKGRITYGMHISKTALMTCLVFNLEESEHVHFLDGGDGGFAIAAKHLKRNISKLQRRDDGKNSV